MRIPAPQARAIQRGAKTQHRVPVDTRLTARPLRPARRHAGRPFNPSADDILPIDGDDRTYCKITAVERVPLGVLTAEQAKAEGYMTVEAFEIGWVECHHREWLDKQIAELVAHGVPEQEALETRPVWARSRYQDYWTTREVWLLTVRPFDDLPYLLPGLPEEPEGIPAEKIHRRWDIKAARRYQEAVTEEERRRDARSLARRVRKFALDGDPIATEIKKLIDGRYQDAA